MNGISRLMKPAGCMYRFMSEWTGAGDGAGAARIIRARRPPVPAADMARDPAVVGMDLIPAAVDTDRGDNNAKKFPTQAFKIKHLHFDYRINTNNGAATVKPV